MPSRSSRPRSTRSERGKNAASIRNALHQLRQDTTRVNGSSNPAVTAPVINVTHKFTHRITTADDGLAVVSIATLFTVIPGSSFSRFRLVKMSVFGAAAPEQFIAIYPSSSSQAYRAGELFDYFAFEDFGIQGSQRPAIHFQPNFAFRSTWNDLTLTSSNELFIVKSLANSEVVLQYTLDLNTTRPVSVP